MVSGGPVLEVVDIEKHYGARPALAGVSLDVRAGEVLGLLGPNGAGKSTLVSIVAGLSTPDAGRVYVDGIDVVAEPSVARSRVGLAPQETGLYELLTVRENLAFFAELAGLRRRARAARIGELASALRLEGLLDRTAFQLSGGERRRVHTAIAFVHRPSLLLLDEATVGADVGTRAALLEVVRAAADDGAAIVYSTHYLPEVEMLGATVALLVDGRVIATGALDVLVNAHGRASVELRFDGPPPESALCGLAATISGDIVRVDAPDPPTAVPEIIDRLGSHVTRLRGVELLRPSLDSVFVALTGRRYDAEVPDVVPS
jgi:ABC-2 type transport system ATP-binding protein